MTSRVVPTRANPFGVAAGQHWESTDSRESRSALAHRIEVVLVKAVHVRRGVATVCTTYRPEYGFNPGVYEHHTRTIRLDRFTPKHHYRLIERKTSQ